MHRFFGILSKRTEVIDFMYIIRQFLIRYIVYFQLSTKISIFSNIMYIFEQIDFCSFAFLFTVIFGISHFHGTGLPLSHSYFYRTNLLLEQYFNSSNQLQ